MSATYYTFKRSARSFEDFAKAERVTVETGLTFADAQDACRDFNTTRTEAEIEAGTKLEFTEE